METKVTNEKPTFSVVGPVYDEVETLRDFYDRVRAAMEAIGEPWELVLVDDGSTDGTSEIIRDLAFDDIRVRPVLFSRNFGHQIAVTAGLDFSRGQAVVIIDTDLQDPPELISELAEKWRAGYEVVYAVRTEREGESWFKRATASAFYRVINRITEVEIPPDAGDFRLLDRKVVNALKTMREHHRFPRAMTAWVGFRQIGIPYKRAARRAGETKYPFRKMVRLAINAITGFSYFPLQLATYFGFLSAALAIVAIPIVVYLRLSGKAELSGQATTLIAVLFLGGVQLISLGILGEYIGRLYDEAKNRPLYILREEPAELAEEDR
ncbi:MAG: glycosyltransferase family 2 protein [Chloroflexi bacterium]|nr:glycosyltransferase family 2 protein [Chloroflexota bacterium]MDK1045647.1 glycosyltransferase family 2 protein [Anaerolineales bacterium]MCI0773398.1 glycosyltransferase family 2 protein [Chloroflexota bacterium]MCI0806827.1 glycosyltransferase family 2 protein [Chloroflexota bacterium]MCI0827050.1 glycosyltransferase family 2 protein [Chloroflexota bacterium]